MVEIPFQSLAKSRHRFEQRRLKRFDRQQRHEPDYRTHSNGR